MKSIFFYKIFYIKNILLLKRFYAITNGALVLKFLWLKEENCTGNIFLHIHSWCRFHPRILLSKYTMYSYHALWPVFEIYYVLIPVSFPWHGACMVFFTSFRYIYLRIVSYIWKKRRDEENDRAVLLYRVERICL